MSSPLTSLSREILRDDTTRSLAAKAIKERVDWTFGYSKYDVEEISGELRDRLHCMEYLGVAVWAILESDSQSEISKASLAHGYLGILPLYVEGRLTKDVYDRWGEMEPTCVVEAADFLQERHLFDWKDDKVLECVLRFAPRSSVRAKRAFLSSVIGRLNGDKRLLHRFTTDVLAPQDEVYREMEALTGGKRDPYGLDGIPESGRKLLVNLQPLLDADRAKSSFGPLADLVALTDRDLVEFFLGVGGLFFLLSGRMNRVVLFRDLAEGMLAKRRIRPIDLLVKLDRRTDRDKFFYDDEAKTRGIYSGSRRAAMRWMSLPGSSRSSLPTRWRRTRGSNSFGSSTGRPPTRASWREP